MNIAKNSKLLIVLLSVLLVSLSGCSKGDVAKTANSEIKTRCINGVNYYLFKEKSGYSGWGFMATKYNRDGLISLCD